MTSEERHELRYQRRKAAREKKRREYLDKYDDFDRVASPQALLRAHWDARKGVMFKQSVLRYDSSHFKNAVKISNRMHKGADIRQGFRSFSICERGKPRNINCLHYAERVIRRSACINALVPILSHNLIYDNGASLKGKGTSLAAKRCEIQLHRFYREYGDNNGWVVSIDFKSYFDTVLHKPLFNIIDRYILNQRLNKLAKDFISAPDLWRDKMYHGKGLYIGPEDSQIFAVAYPSPVDHLIKDQWSIHYYARYVDDSYLIVRTKAEAKALLEKLKTVYAGIGIVLHPRKTHISKLSHGFTFLKTRYYLQANGKVVRKPCKDSVVRERRKLKRQYKKFYLTGILSSHDIAQSYMSWRGAIAQRDAFDVIKSMDWLFFSLFGWMPWLKNKSKRSKYNGQRNNAGRDSGTQRYAHAVRPCAA